MMAGIFLFLYKSLPGETGLVKGLSFALLVWFFRVVMSAASSWIMFRVPGSALIYTLVAGFWGNVSAGNSVWTDIEILKRRQGM
jgi:hypothetical protein